MLHKAVCMRTIDLTDTVNLPNKVILWAPAVLEYLHSLTYSVALMLEALGSLNLCCDMKRSYINIVEKISFEFNCVFSPHFINFLKSFTYFSGSFLFKFITLKKFIL